MKIKDKIKSKTKILEIIAERKNRKDVKYYTFEEAYEL
jgi:hypothetical protein